MFFVLIDGVGTPLTWKDENEALFQQRLAVAYTEKKAAFCSCRDGEGTRLSIRRLGSAEVPFYVLARWPKSGLKHRAECPFFGSDAGDDGRLAPGVVRLGNDGLLALRLEPSLARPAKTASAEPPGVRNGPRAQPPIALRELLELLWEQADLARWDPRFTGRRTAYVVAGALAHAAEGIVLGRRRLAERLIAIVPKPSERGIAAAHERWDDAARGNEGVLVVGTLRAAPEEPALGHDRAGIFLHAAAGAFKIVLEATDAVISGARTSFRRELAAFAAPDDDRDAVVAIANVRPRPLARQYRVGEIVDVALMRVTPAWIPVESSHESRIARLLVAQHRAFSKPLRYSGELVQPDFVLLDTGHPYPLEVYGMDHAAYVARKAAKSSLYERDYGGRVWSWDATTAPTPMPFPPRVTPR